jgi:chromosome segregation ATPase
MVVDYINETAELEDDVNELNELRDTNKELESDIDDLEDEKDELRETIASLKESMKGIAEDIVEGVSGKEEDYAEDLKLVKDIINQVIEGKR